MVYAHLQKSAFKGGHAAYSIAELCYDVLLTCVITFILEAPQSGKYGISSNYFLCKNRLLWHLTTERDNRAEIQCFSFFNW